MSIVIEAFSFLESRTEHFLKRMGWLGTTTPLESLMLIVSEVGEAANEVRGETPTDHYAEELADIVLRVVGEAAHRDINLGDAIIRKMRKWDTMEPGHKGRLK